VRDQPSLSLNSQENVTGMTRKIGQLIQDAGERMTANFFQRRKQNRFANSTTVRSYEALLGDITPSQPVHQLRLNGSLGERHFKPCLNVRWTSGWGGLKSKRCVPEVAARRQSVHKRSRHNFWKMQKQSGTLPLVFGSNGEHAFESSESRRKVNRKYMENKEKAPWPPVSTGTGSANPQRCEGVVTCL